MLLGNCVALQPSFAPQIDSAALRAFGAAAPWLKHRPELLQAVLTLVLQRLSFGGSQVGA